VMMRSAYLLVVRLRPRGFSTRVINATELNSMPGPYENRLGRFWIGYEDVMGHPDEVRELLSHVVIIGCEPRFERAAFEYRGYSRLFRMVAETAIPPYYTVSRLSGKLEFENVL
jgi:hypothetical protein